LVYCKYGKHYVDATTLKGATCEPCLQKSRNKRQNEEAFNKLKTENKALQQKISQLQTELKSAHQLQDTLNTTLRNTLFQDKKESEVDKPTVQLHTCKISYTKAAKYLEKLLSQAVEAYRTYTKGHIERDILLSLFSILPNKIIVPKIYQ